MENFENIPQENVAENATIDNTADEPVSSESITALLKSIEEKLSERNAETPSSDPRLDEIARLMKKMNRKSTTRTVLTVICTLCIIVIMLAALYTIKVMVPQVSVALDSATTALNEAKVALTYVESLDFEGVNSVINGVEGTLGEIAKIDFDSLADSVESLRGTVKQIEQIDFESLNNAIQDLDGVLEPIANFFKPLTKKS